jgi:Tyrosinase co-factor MelC1.
MGLTTGRTGTAVRARGPARRFVLRTAFAVTVTAGTAGALLPVLTRDPGTGSRSRTGGDSGQDTDFGKNGVRGLERFAETYRGRLIEGAATPMVRAGAPGAYPPDIGVRIDGRPLHVMRRVDGSYLSNVNHYESFPTLLETARAAVDVIGSAQLAMIPPHSI